MKVLVVGGGGREHAIAWRLHRDRDVAEVVCAPGNPGVAAVGRCLEVDLSDAAAVLAVAEREDADLTVVGPETALDHGVVDSFRKAGRPIVGPSRKAAALECSKSYAKGFMTRAGIPTARFVVCDKVDIALDAVSGRSFGFPVVVKADGLAAGKGVVVAGDLAEAETAVRAAMVERQFGNAGARVVIEECLVGPEVSFFVLSDGDAVLPLASAQDHKRVGDGDRGPNTGGMGAFAPSPLLTPASTAEVMTRIVLPVIKLMRDEGEPYRGFLYVSVMLTLDGPKVIEFNVRFGDPEAQVIMPMLEGQFAKALLASATTGLTNCVLETNADRFVGVVLASRGYPGVVEVGKAISGLEQAATLPGVLLFHAGTRRDGGNIVTSGGRVLTVVGRGSTFEIAVAAAYAAVNEIRFDGMHYRHDIGKKAISATAADP